MRPPIAIWDLDGVLADVRHRLIHVETYPKDWDAFFAAAVDDPVLPDGRALLEQHLAAGHSIAYLSGRPERCRRDTLAWLARHGLPDAPLMLRRSRDYRPARVVKLEYLQTLALEAQIVEIVDDDVSVVEELLAAGFPVRHATWMTSAEPSVLWRAQEEDGRT